MGEIDRNEAFGRLRMMASGRGKWDLSPNDEESIRVVLAEFNRVVEQVEEAKEEAIGYRSALSDLYAVAANVDGVPALEEARKKARMTLKLGPAPAKGKGDSDG